MIARWSGFVLLGVLAACTMERRGETPGGAAAGGTGRPPAAANAPRDTVTRDSLSELLTAADFVEAGTSHTIPVPMDTAGPPGLAADAELSRSLALLGSAGPYAFVQSQLWAFSCGAHGNVDARFHVINLATGAEDTLLDSAAAAALTAPLKDRIIAAFKADTSEVGRSIEQPDSARLTLLVPQYAGGRLTFLGQFTAEACYACSDTRWDSYSRSVRLPLPTLPPALQALTSIPPEVQAGFRILSPDSGGGWSAVTLPGPRRDALAHLFGVTAPIGGVPEYLVWHRLPGGGFETAWFRGRGAEATIVGRQPDVWIVAGGHAWSWRTRQDRVKVTPCSMQKQGGNL